MKRRFLSVLLCVAMLCGLLAGVSFAVETDPIVIAGTAYDESLKVGAVEYDAGNDCIILRYNTDPAAPVAAATYKVNVTTAGTYSLSINYQKRYGGDHQVGLAVNGGETAEINVEKCEAEFKDANLGEITLNAGENTITLTDDEAAATGKTVTFTSEEGGVFIFSTTHANASFFILDTFDFVEGAHTAALVLEPGQTITIECYTLDQTGADVTLHIEEYEIPEGVVDTELELGENTVFVPMDNAYLGLEVTFVAENAGTYIFTTGENAWLFNLPGGNVKPENTLEVELEAGQTLTFKVGTDNELADNVLVTIELKEEEPVDPPVDPQPPVVDPEDPIDPTGDSTILVFVLMAMSVSAIVVLVSKKRAF